MESISHVLSEFIFSIIQLESLIPVSKCSINGSEAISLIIENLVIKTNYVPHKDGEIKLGYEGDNNMSKDFIGQFFYGFKKED